MLSWLKNYCNCFVTQLFGYHVIIIREGDALPPPPSRSVVSATDDECRGFKMLKCFLQKNLRKR